MAKMLKLRLGVSDDPSALQPTLNDCLEAMVQQSELLMTDVINGLILATSSTAPQRVAGFQKGGIKQAIDALARNSKSACVAYRTELSRVMYEGGGKEQVPSEMLRYEDLQLFEDAQLDQSIEVARAQQEVALSVDDVLPTLDALISTMLGWRTIQPGLNPLRPEVFVRALQATLAAHVPDNAVREALITPAAGLLGANLRKLYRELADWLVSTGIEPAVPLGGRLQHGGGATGKPVNDTMAKTLLTLDKLLKLLAGDFDSPAPRADFLHTVPASMAMLQEMKQVDALVKRLEERPRATPAPTAAPVSMLDAEPPPAANPLAQHKIGQQLGDEVVRLMFDNLLQDRRLMPAFKQRLKAMEPAVHRLSQHDSRFFSDRTHPARMFLDRVTQRSLAFSAETDEGWPRFVGTVESALKWLDSKVVDADVFGELLDHLQEQWTEHDRTLKAKREEAARALLHAEQRNMLAQKLATEFTAAVEGLEVAQFVVDFLKNSWSQVVAEAQLSCADGSDDPYGYHALVDDLIWSVQKSTAQRGRNRRLAQMIPGLLSRLREGLQRIDYPAELTKRFFDNLITIHEAALQEGRDEAKAAAAEAAESAPSEFSDTSGDSGLWVADQEAQESGFYDEEAYLPSDAAAAAAAAAAEPPPPPTAAPLPAAAAPQELRTGTWCELYVNRQWTRVQLTWASPHATLFMFTSQAGTAHSMSRRTLDRLRAQGLLRIVADRPVIDEALDQVAQAALKNSLGNTPEGA
jgi:hypothetical protein